MTEAMLAIVILATSMLGIAATSARVGQAVNTAHVRAAAVEQARARLATLLSEPFGDLADGTATSGEVDMEWFVTTTDRAQEVTLVYRYDVPGKTRQDTIVSARLDR